MRLIDADALKSALEIEQYNDYDDLLRTERLIDNAPTIKTFTLADIEAQYRKGLEKGLEERPHGKWKAFNFHIIYCNNCGMNIDIMKCKFLDLLKFCPNCGASMIKKEGETE